MPRLTRRNGIWRYSFTVGGQRIRKSARTADRDLAEAIAWLIEDETWGYVGEPTTDERERAIELWLVYAERRGVTGLMDMFERVMEPNFDRMDRSEATGKFRPDG